MIEEQALCRVHRVGQKRDVTTIRYLMRDSFEEVSPHRPTHPSLLMPGASSKPLLIIQGTNNHIANCRYPKAEKDAGTSDVCPRYLVRSWHWFRNIAGTLWTNLQFKHVFNIATVLEICPRMRRQDVFCHNDLSMQNVIVDPISLKIRAIIDWKYAGFYPEYFDTRFYKRLGPSIALEGEKDDSEELLDFLNSYQVLSFAKYQGKLLLTFLKYRNNYLLWSIIFSGLCASIKYEGGT